MRVGAFELANARANHVACRRPNFRPRFARTLAAPHLDKPTGENLALRSLERGFKWPTASSIHSSWRSGNGDGLNTQEKSVRILRLARHLSPSQRYET